MTDPVQIRKSEPEQLELFDTAVIELPPCGRGGPCQAVFKSSTSGGFLHCLTCGCVTPLVKRGNAGFLDGYIQSQLKFLGRMS
jgi:hypothetical protein